MKKIALSLGMASIVLFTGCTHKQVKVNTLHDDKMSCTEIAMEYAKTEMVLEDIDDKTGFSGRNVAMGIFFWPGIVVNQMNAGDAREAARNRLDILAKLSSNKSCNLDKSVLSQEKEKLKKEMEEKKEDS